MSTRLALSLPPLAFPDHELLDLLERLANRRGIHVHIVTGRTRASIVPWLGHLPLTLHAERGFWPRVPGEAWTRNGLSDGSWKDAVRSMVQQFVDGTLGSLLEEKDASLALHYRNVDPSVARERLRWLREELWRRVVDELDVREEAKVSAIRLRGVHKGLIGSALASRVAPGTVIIASGDDRTDEDLFSSLPSYAVTIKVGAGNTQARYTVPDYKAVRASLSQLAAS